MRDDIQKILVVGPAWVGDMVMAQSLFIDLKARHPDLQIDLLAPTWTAALVDRMPQINQLINANFKHGKLSLGERYSLGKQLRKNGYDHAIVLPNSLKSALVPAIARIPIRTGFVGEQRWGLLNDIRKLDKTERPMTVQRFIALGESKTSSPRSLNTIPKPKLEVDEATVSLVLEKNTLGLNKPILALCPGAEFGASKQWPSEHYAAVANHYLAQGWQVWLMGSESDQPICHVIKQACKNNIADKQNFRVLAGKTTLPEAIDLMSLARLAISNDSGLMHIAAALQTPLVAVYGSTDPGHTPPLSDNHAVARLNLDCSPCFKRDCPLQHLNCLRELGPDQILTTAATL